MGRVELQNVLQIYVILAASLGTYVLLISMLHAATKRSTVHPPHSSRRRARRRPSYLVVVRPAEHPADQRWNRARSGNDPQALRLIAWRAAGHRDLLRITTPKG